MLNRVLAGAAAPLLDAALFCALAAGGLAFRSSHIASFAAAMALNYLLKVRSSAIPAGRAWDWRLHGRLLAAVLMALFLRGGVLGLLSLRFGWPAAGSIALAVLVGHAAAALGCRQALASNPAVATNYRTLATWLIVYAFVLRLVYLGSVELLPEEAYYWEYSVHLDYGYLDHPPMVAWLIRLGTAAFGQSQFGVRAGAVCCAIVTSVFTYRLTRNLCGEACALAALLLAQVLPFFFLSGLLMTPDAPLTAAWAASLYYLERALVAESPGAWWRAGLALGIGAISKYSIGLLIPVTVAFMVLDPRSRQWWYRRQTYVAALLAVAVFSPVILWNARHEWVSFAFQTSRRLAEVPRFALHKLVASALVLITPTGALAVAAGFGGDHTDRGWRFIRTALLVPLFVFALFSLRHEVKLDWTGAPWTAALPLMAAGMLAGPPLSRLRAWIRDAWMPTLVTMLLIFGAGLHYLVLGLPGIGYGKHNELLPVGWRDFGRRIESTVAGVRAAGLEPLIVGMDRYAIASELAFYVAERTRSPVETSSAHLFGGIGLMYERWTPPDRQEGRTLLLVAWDPKDLEGSAVESHAEGLGPVGQEEIMRDGVPVRRYYYRLAYNYRTVARP